jgi:predicted transcriptional regulator
MVNNYFIIQPIFNKERMILVKGIILFSYDDNSFDIVLTKIISNKKIINLILNTDIFFENQTIEKSFRALLNKPLIDINNILLENFKNKKYIYKFNVKNEYKFESLKFARQTMYNLQTKLLEFYNEKIKFLKIVNSFETKLLK